ncbi:MAG TPA: LacI family DNA-binding transcriptional regulator, partial [Bacillota bacterium]|nr:LacI family DNA-binding transcriptional regulator [Bacillota bacterium]
MYFFGKLWERSQRIFHKAEDSMKTLTIYDIARMAKVSRSTVSRVLNNSENVSDEVRERVLKVIRETNYEPNVRARSLTVKKANTIAVIHMAGRKWIENIESNPFYSEVMQGILREAMHYRYMVSQFMIMKESDLENILKMVRGRAIDGLALVGHFHPELINRLSEERLPLVLIDNDLPEMEISSVCSDNKTGITL